jgi:hypothetical protein
MTACSSLARTLLLVAAPLSLSAGSLEAAAAHPLRVSPDGRHLVRADGRPFFYLADTAWSLFHRLSREEADLYLRNRAAKGFTVIQAVALSENDGLRTPNAYGERPLLDNDPRRPNERYFAHVDWVIDRAAELGLTVALLPTWGDKWHSRQNEPGPKVFHDPPAARDFARFVGRRYGSRPVVFVLGGDRNVETPERPRDHPGLRRGPEGGRPEDARHLPPAGSRPLLRHPSPRAVARLQHDPVVPHGPGLRQRRQRRARPRARARQAHPRRRAPLRGPDGGLLHAGRAPGRRLRRLRRPPRGLPALLAGAAGHTYGNNNIWQMWAPGREGVLGANTPWNEAIDHPGAFQMGHVRRLFESRPWERLVPAQDLLAGPNLPGEGLVRAALAADRSFAFVYSPRGEPVSVHQDRLGAVDVTAWWFDPRYGRAHFVHTGVGTAIQVFTPPSSGRGCDWVLVLDDASKGYPPPGELRK